MNYFVISKNDMEEIFFHVFCKDKRKIDLQYDAIW
jgi:hypothetical protein